MINAGIPSWRVKVCAGYVQASSTAPLGGHGYAIYLADRDDSERGFEWVILDWCYIADPKVEIQNKPLAREGGQQNAYKDIWFTFNDEYSWSQTWFEITSERISRQQKTKLEDVIEKRYITVTEVMKYLDENITRQIDDKEKIAYRFL